MRRNIHHLPSPSLLPSFLPSLAPSPFSRWLSSVTNGILPQEKLGIQHSQCNLHTARDGNFKGKECRRWESRAKNGSLEQKMGVWREWTRRISFSCNRFFSRTDSRETSSLKLREFYPSILFPVQVFSWKALQQSEFNCFEVFVNAVSDFFLLWIIASFFFVLKILRLLSLSVTVFSSTTFLLVCYISIVLFNPSSFSQDWRDQESRSREILHRSTNEHSPTKYCQRVRRLLYKEWKRKRNG